MNNQKLNTTSLLKDESPTKSPFPINSSTIRSDTPKKITDLSELKIKEENFSNLPKFIVFEGGDGSGKSTQLELLSELLTLHNVSHICTKEPGGTNFSQTIRTLLKDPKHNLSIETELLAFSASRRDHIDKTVKPALKQSKIILCDRFYLSTLIYQISSIPEHRELFYNILPVAIDGVEPDLTAIFDITYEDAQNRIVTRSSIDSTPDTFDSSPRMMGIYSQYIDFNSYSHNTNLPVIHLDSKQDIYSLFNSLLVKLNLL